MTRAEYIKDFARQVRPIFVANKWEWSLPTVGHGMMGPRALKVPTQRDIVRMCNHLVKSFDEMDEDGDDCCYNGSGRIVVIRDAEGSEHGFILCLEF